MTSKSSAIQILSLSIPGTRFFATGFFAPLLYFAAAPLNVPEFSSTTFEKI